MEKNQKAIQSAAQELDWLLEEGEVSSATSGSPHQHQQLQTIEGVRTTVKQRMDYVSRELKKV